MSKFLNQLLKALPFPEYVWPEVLDTYAPRYSLALASNQNLGSHATDLAARFVATDDFAGLVRLIHQENHDVLDFLLAGPLNNDRVITEIISTWYLSPTDQLRLVARDLSPNSAAQILHDLAFNDETKDIARGFLSFNYDNFHVMRYTQGQTPSYTHPRSKPKPRPRTLPDVMKYETTQRFSVTTTPLSLDSSIENLSCLISGLHRLADPLSASLGTGETKGSLRAWQLFLSLAEGDPNVPLQNVITAALSLARAER